MSAGTPHIESLISKLTHFLLSVQSMNPVMVCTPGVQTKAPPLDDGIRRRCLLFTERGNEHSAAEGQSEHGGQDQA